MKKKKREKMHLTSGREEKRRREKGEPTATTQGEMYISTRGTQNSPIFILISKYDYNIITHSIYKLGPLDSKTK